MISEKDLRLDFIFLVDAVEVLFPAHHLGGVAFLLEGGLDLVADLVDQFLAVAAGGAQRGCDPRCPHGIQGAEAEVFEFHAHGVHAQAHGDGCIDVEGFAGDAADFVGTEYTQRAHVVQPVGQL